MQTTSETEITTNDLDRIRVALDTLLTVVVERDMRPGSWPPADGGVCKCRFDFPQKRRSKIPQFGGRAISRWVDRRLRFWAAFRDVSVSAEWGWVEGWLCS